MFAPLLVPTRSPGVAQVMAEARKLAGRLALEAGPFTTDRVERRAQTTGRAQLT
jgi:hypothetical protein